MAHIIIKPGWHIPERLVTPEHAVLDRRRFLKQMGFTGGALAALAGGGALANAAKKGYPYPRNMVFSPPGKLSDERTAATYNNFYEFSTTKDRVHELVGPFVVSPWSIEIGGLVEKPMKIDVAELIDTMPMEERVYRFRCVEAWAMVVPWTGFPLKKLIEKVQPKPEAKFVKFQTAFRPNQMPGTARLRSYPWPYTEGLRMDEAMNDLTLVTTGIFGKPLPKQHGAPIRIVVPWKYGYKSIKSVDKIEFVATQPKTLWETLAPDEYPFESNVDPRVPHPRWSQATERMIDSGDRVRTQLYNGYGDYVAKLYQKR
ncbi:MAG: protein-methionine-sulfoxide reductase catalytic subunit MsrP [Verrucomicrobiota bacterium]